MDRFLPEVTPGGTDASLLVAQQDDRSSPMALQQQHTALPAIQLNNAP